MPTSLTILKPINNIIINETIKNKLFFSFAFKELIKITNDINNTNIGIET